MKLQNLLSKLDKNTRVVVCDMEGKEVCDVSVNPLDLIPLLNYYVESIKIENGIGLYIVVKKPSSTRR